MELEATSEVADEVANELEAPSTVLEETREVELMTKKSEELEVAKLVEDAGVDEAMGSLDVAEGGDVDAESSEDEEDAETLGERRLDSGRD